ncbi:MAG TPA: hydrogenase maturation nickel metallochaperone HypA [Gemmatimonadaceae bacterium]|jgi:hydrogenase nickel incorporation protein HypA/HybF|nr:hydrogenase maturation nickel metallochaperone HypA [Gemmatimonadaceae bacterium]
MHELAIADAVVSMLAEQTTGQRVSRVGMRIGHLRQVVPSSLRFSFALVAKDTPLDGAELEIEPVPAAVWCATCAVESEPHAFPLVCDRCRTTDVRVTRGEEMLVDWIETEE